MVDNEIKFERLHQYKADVNPVIIIRIKETKGRHLVIAAIYRQRKAPGETGANTADGISRQCARLKAMTDKLSII